MITSAAHLEPVVATRPSPPVLIHVPPHDLGAEASVLGAMLTDPEAIPRVFEVLDEEHFYAGPNRRLFREIRTLFDAGTIPDPVTVIAALERAGALADAGGREGVAGLIVAVESSANVEHWARIVLDRAVQRRLAILGADLAAAAREKQDPAALAELAQRALAETEFAAAPRVSFATVLDEVFKQIGAPVARRGVPTTYTALDDVLGGFNPGTFNVLGARPGMGKTTLAINIAANLALMGVSVAFFTMEMSRTDLTRKVLSCISGVAEKRLRGGHILTDDERRLVTDAAAALKHAPLFIEYGDFSTTTLRARLRRLRLQNQIDLAVIDYLGLIQPAVEQRNLRSQVDRITHVSGALKSMAVSVDVPLLVLAQLSRANARDNEAVDPAEAAKKGKKAYRWPGLTDLRDSGSIEQDADSVTFLHRDGYYSKDHLDSVANVIVEKNRYGECRDVKLAFVPWCQRFAPLDVTASGSRIP